MMRVRNGAVHERIATRFGATLLANLARGGLSFASSTLTARALGASGYGDLMFLLGSFTAINQLFDMGTSSAFYTFISRRARGLVFLSAYAGWTAFQFLAMVVAVGVLFPQSLIERIWVGHGRGSVLLAFGVSYMMNQAWGTVSQLGEAGRKTVLVQAAAIAQALAHFALIALLTFLGRLSMGAVLWLLIIEHVLLTVVCGPRWARDHLAAPDSGNDRYGTVLREFTLYCRPLAGYAWLSFLYTFADRWMLQRVGGAAEQGFFSVGQQFASVSLIATTSILKVFWKEIAEAQERSNQQQMQALYRIVSRCLYFSGAWISCLLIPYSKEVLRWTVGGGYEAAWLCLAMMFVFPVHQSLGQTQGTFFYATSDTRSYTRIGLIAMAVSIPLTYLLVAPKSGAVAGLALGALGIAIKLVSVQVVQVNLQAYVIARHHRWAYDCAYQAFVLTGLLGLSWASKGAFQSLFMLCGLESPAGVMLAGGVAYTLLSLATLNRAPWLAGLTTADVRHAVSAAAEWWRPPCPVAEG